MDNNLRKQYEKEVYDARDTGTMKTLAKFLDLEYDYLKEKLVDNDDATLRGQAQYCRRLRKLLQDSVIVDSKERLEY